MSSKLYIAHISKTKFDFLAKYKDLYCISIYLPLSLKGTDVTKKIRYILFKQSDNSHLKREVQGMNTESIETHLKEMSPIIKTWEESDSIKNISIFMSNEITEVFELKSVIKFRIYINDHFYLKYFIQELNNDSKKHQIFWKSEIVDNRLLDDVNQIIKLSAKGQIKVLFLTKDKDLFGELDEENDFVMTFNEDESGTSLSNLAAMKTIVNDGDVVILDENQMPNPNKLINAIKQ